MSEPTKSLRDIVSFQTRDSAAGKSARGGPFSAGGLGGRIRTRLLIGATFAVICAGGAAYMANVWFQSQAAGMRSAAGTEASEPQIVRVPTRTVVVAASNLPYGSEITADAIREIEWPEDSVPEGTFESVDELLSDQARVALVPLARNEVVLTTRVSGPGQRASLSAMLEPGMKAVAIRVDDVLGVAGLIQTGDRVDVIWTRSSGARDDDSYTELLLRDIKVLAIDQRVDEGAEERDGKADVARSVTVEVDVVQAQKIALAANSGKLILALRHLGEEVDEASRRVTLTELGVRPNSEHSRGAPAVTETERELAAAGFGVRMLASASGETPPPPIRRRVRDDYVVIGVRRGLERSEYNVMATQGR